MEHDKWTIIINIIVGLVLGYILYRGYLYPSIIKGPNSKDIIDKIYQYNGKKYTLKPIVCGCLHK
jgi:hypothetical protein